MGLLANGLVAIRRVPQYSVCGLITSMTVPYSWLDGFPAFRKIIVAGTLGGLPIFFSGLIFSQSFRDVKQPSRGLGINLLGCGSRWSVRESGNGRRHANLGCSRHCFIWSVSSGSWPLLGRAQVAIFQKSGSTRSAGIFRIGSLRPGVT